MERVAGMGKLAGIRRFIVGLALGLTLVMPVMATDWERGFRNYDRIEAGEITEQSLTEQERIELQLIRNTLEYFENQAVSAEAALDCHALEQARSRQGQLLTGDARRLSSCARRNDLQALASRASRLASCAGSAAQGGLQDCNSVVASIRADRDDGCANEIRQVERSQRRLTSLRLQSDKACAVQ